MGETGLLVFVILELKGMVLCPLGVLDAVARPPRVDSSSDITRVEAIVLR